MEQGFVEDFQKLIRIFMIVDKVVSKAFPDKTVISDVRDIYSLRDSIVNCDVIIREDEEIKCKQMF